MDLKKIIRDFPDFPKPDIVFKDISPILESPEAMNYIENEIYRHFKDHQIDVIAGAESRGLIFACSIATRLCKPLVMVRKQGKLPGPTLQESYALEYGEATMEIQVDAVKPGQNVLLVDDLLATGGTALAASRLVEKAGGKVIGHAFVIELTFINGREKLKEYDIQTLVQYDSE